MTKNDRRENYDYLDDDERDLIESLDRDEWVSVHDRSDVVAEAVSVALATLRKDRRMNIRISERDLRGLKARVRNAVHLIRLPLCY